MNAERDIFPTAIRSRGENDGAFTELECSVDALGQTRTDALANHQSIDDGLHVVRPGPGELGGILHFDDLAINPGPEQARAADRHERLGVFPFAAAN